MSDLHTHDGSAIRKGRAIRVIALFFTAVTGLMLASAKSPLGIPLTQATLETIQIVDTAPIHYQDGYTLRRQYIGIVEAGQSSRIGFEVSGLLNTLNINDGDTVQKNEVLAILDTARLDARKKEAQAALKRAKANAKLADSTFKRIDQARNVNAVSAQERDEAEQAKNAAQAAVDVAQAQLETIEVDLEKSKILAPFDGVIISRLRDEGTVVNAGEPIIHIQESGAMEARIGVTPALANTLQIDTQKDILINKVKTRATISRIMPVRADNRAVDIIFDLKDNSTTIRSGDMARLQMEQVMIARGFWIPLSALREGRRGLWSIYVASADQNTEENIYRAERRTVEVIDIQNDQAFVRGSVDENERAIVRGAHKIVPDQQVRLQNKDKI